MIGYKSFQRVVGTPKLIMQEKKTMINLSHAEVLRQLVQLCIDNNADYCEFAKGEAAPEIEDALEAAKSPVALPVWYTVDNYTVLVYTTLMGEWHFEFR